MVDTQIRNFREAVLDAYDNRCAVTGLQLCVVQAVHILPVCFPGSVDIVPNGIALSPTYSVAYENGLIFLDDQLRVRLNEDKARILRLGDLHGGLHSFTDSLGEIVKPTNREHWPDPELIDRANRLREIST